MHLHVRLASASLLMLLAACGGGGGADPGAGATPPNPLSSPGTMVSVTFLGSLPNAVAVAPSNGVFTASTLSSNKLTFLVPAGTNAYAFAVACPAVNVSGTLIAEYVFEANLSDGATYSVSPCFAPAAATGAATGAFDVSAIPGAVKARIAGAQGYSGDVNGTTGTFSVSMPVGTNDIAVLALDGGGNVLAVRMLRSQIVPGSVNAGATIVVNAADEVSTEAVTVMGVPPGFPTPPALNAGYLTANGTFLSLNNGSAFAYPALSPADLSALDQYQINSNSSNTSINEAIGTTLFAVVGNPVTLTYPPAWTYTPPAAAVFPTFSFVYSGFRGLATQTYRGQIAWPAGVNTTDQLTVFASAAYLGTQTSVAIPNLTALPGFFGSAATAVTVNWLAEIDGGTFQSYIVPAPAPGSLSYVQARGTYVEP